jgi:hypothetical protein
VIAEIALLWAVARTALRRHAEKSPAAFQQTFAQLGRLAFERNSTIGLNFFMWYRYCRSTRHPQNENDNVGTNESREIHRDKSPSMRSCESRDMHPSNLSACCQPAPVNPGANGHVAT